MSSVQETRQKDRILEQFSQQAAPLSLAPGGSQDGVIRRLLTATEVKATDTVLDVACGTGQLALAFADVAKHVTGIDITPAMIEQAKELQCQANVRNIHWFVGDAYRLPFADASFSIVTCRYALHHMLQPNRAAAEMVRVCAPGGRVCFVDAITTRDKSAAFDRMERLRDPSHVRALTLEELIGITKASGLGDPICDFYSFDIELETLLTGSFPSPHDKDEVRKLILENLDRNELGIGVHHDGSAIIVSYPIAIVTASHMLSNRN